MAADGAAEPASEKSQPWWATDPEIARQTAVRRFGDVGLLD